MQKSTPAAQTGKTYGLRNDMPASAILIGLDGDPRRRKHHGKESEEDGELIRDGFGMGGQLNWREYTYVYEDGEAPSFLPSDGINGVIRDDGYFYDIYDNYFFDYKYDAGGRLVSKSGTTIVIEYEYDDKGNILLSKKISSVAKHINMSIFMKTVLSKQMDQRMQIMD